MEKNYTVVLGAYKGIPVPQLPTEVTDEDIKQFMTAQQQIKATLIDVDEAARNGDTVVIDYAGFLGDEQFEGGTAEEYPLELGSGSFIPGFEEQLVGTSAGDQVVVHVTFPQEYHAEHLAGKPVIFQCLVHKVQRKHIPELGDELAKAFQMENYETLVDLARNYIAQQKQANNGKAIQDIVIQKLTETCAVTLKEEFIEFGIKQYLDAFEHQLASQGLSKEDYLQYTKMTEDELKAQFRPQAEAGAKINAILSEIAEKENIVVTDEELEEQLGILAEQNQLVIDELKKRMGESNISAFRISIVVSKALDFVVSQTVTA